MHHTNIHIIIALFLHFLEHCAFEETDVKTHTLFIHKDIDVHYPPEVSNNFQKNKNNKQSAEVTFCNVRPILKMPSISPRSCRGSQTDISALCSGLVDQSTGKIYYQGIDIFRDLDILLSSNQNIHKSSSGHCFWASDPLINGFCLNLSIKGSEA